MLKTLTSRCRGWMTPDYTMCGPCFIVFGSNYYLSGVGVTRDKRLEHLSSIVIDLARSRYDASVTTWGYWAVLGSWDRECMHTNVPMEQGDDRKKRNNSITRWGEPKIQVRQLWIYLRKNSEPVDLVSCGAEEPACTKHAPYRCGAVVFTIMHCVVQVPAIEWILGTEWKKYCDVCHWIHVLCCLSIDRRCSIPRIHNGSVRWCQTVNSPSLSRTRREHCNICKVYRDS